MHTVAIFVFLFKLVRIVTIHRAKIMYNNYPVKRRKKCGGRTEIESENREKKKKKAKERNTKEKKNKSN